MTFRTEKQMEAELVPVPRTLDMPDGGEHVIAMPPVYWQVFDYILKRFSTHDGLLTEAARLAQVHRVSLDTALAHQCAKLYKWGRDVVGVKVPFTPPLDPLCYLPDVPQEFIDRYRRSDIQ